MFLRCPAVPGIDNRFFGAMGLMTLIGNSSMQFLKAGIARADMDELKPFSLSDPQLARILQITKNENEHIVIPFDDNTNWNDMILTAGK